MFMKTYITTLSVLFSLSFSIAQNSVKKDLENITDIDTATEYVESKKSKHNKVLTFNEAKHKTKLAKALFKLSNGGSKTVKSDFEKVHYKVIEKAATPHYRANIIYFDGNVHSLADINKTRDYITKKFNLGMPFQDLAKNYSMHPTAKKGGDLGWFTEGNLPTELDKEIVSGRHDLNTIFSVDIPKTKGYYLVTIPEVSKTITEVKVIKVVEAL